MTATRAKVELAQGLLATYKVMDLRTGISTCVHCNCVCDEENEPDEDHDRARRLMIDAGEERRLARQ